MRIVDLERRARGPWVRLQARLAPDAPGEPLGDAWIEVPEAQADGLRLGGEPFLLAAFVPAMAAGTARIQVEGTLDPVLRRGVAGAVRILRTWSPAWPEPVVEAGGGFVPPSPPPVARTATTFAGGVDSLATLRRNRLDVPADHPAAVREGLFVFGFNSFDFADGKPVPARERDFAARLDRWQPLAREAGIDLVPVRTNIRTLAPSFEVWARRTMGAGLAAVAHALGGRLTRFLVPSAGRRDPFHVDGTHPALDPLYSGAGLHVVHDALDLSRLEKLELLAGWPAALSVLQPCQQVELQDAAINCGNCNKCRRTMLGFEALGILGGNTLFPRDRIDAEWVADMRIAQAFDFDYLEELIPRLEARGRADLVRALRDRRQAWDRKQRRGLLRGLRRKGGA